MTATSFQDRPQSPALRLGATSGKMKDGQLFTTGLLAQHQTIYSQRIDAEAKVLKLEQELSEAKALQLKLTAKTSFLVSDIRKVGSDV